MLSARQVGVLSIGVIFLMTSASAADEEAVAELLLAPTQGRPVFVEPGDTLPVVAQLANADETVVYTLVRARSPVRRYTLEVVGGGPGDLSTGRAVAVRVPRDVPEDTYDLELRSGATRLVGRHSVAVKHVGRRIRIAHLSNMNVGDVSAPDFDHRLIDEINLLAPTLIVATGDYLDVTHEDPEAGWRQLSDFLARFDAPTLMACGDHDDLRMYSRLAAPSPIGTIELGWYRGVVLFDHPSLPIDVNAEQIEWLERTLARPGWDGVTFVVTHDDFPSLLRYWQRRGRLAAMIRSTHIGVWFAGGHTDWDGREYQDLVQAAAPLLFIRTHQASTATRAGADGVSHYRVVDLVGQRAFVLAEDSQARLPPSIAVGRLHATLQGANDGSRARVRFTAVNHLPQRMDALGLRVQVQKTPGSRPWCHGARLVSAVDLGEFWECRVSFDLPDKGTLRAVVGGDAEPARPRVQVRFDVGDRLRLQPKTTRTGVSYLSASNQAAIVLIENRGEEPVEVKPVVRLDGTIIPYRLIEEHGSFVMAYRLRLLPQRSALLELDLSAIRAAPGRRDLQVYLMGLPTITPFAHTLKVRVED